MIKLTDILKEIEGAPSDNEANLKRVRDEIESGMFNWDKTGKQIAAAVLKNSTFNQEEYNSIENFEEKKNYVAQSLESMTREKIVNSLKSARQKIKSPRVGFRVTTLLNILGEK